MRPPRHRRLGGCLLVAALGGAPLAEVSAQTVATDPAAPPAPRTAALSWVRLPGAATCSSASEMARRVEAILKREALVPPARADLSAEVRVERVAARRRFRAVIQVADATGAIVGDRSIETTIDDCRRLDEPVALAIALMIDPEAMTRPPPPPPAPPPPPMIAVVRDVVFVPVAVEAPPAPTPPTPRVRTPEAPSFAVAVGPTLALGLVPGPAAGARVAVEIGPPADLDPEGLAWAPSSLRLGFAGYGGSLEVQGPGRSATLSLAALLPRLEACPTTAWAHARVAFGVCAALDVGALTWTGEGFDTPVASGSRPAVDLGPLAHLRVLIAAPLSLEVRGAAVIPLIRDRFVYGRAEGGAGTGLAYEPGAIAATLDAGLHLGFDP